MITVLDYGVGNIASVQKAFEHLGHTVNVTQNPNDIDASTFLVVPGQGAIKQALTALTDLNLKEPLLNYLKAERPFLGICLGFQLLFEHCEEHGGHDGLGIFKGTVKRFDDTHQKVPHMGWNDVQFTGDMKPITNTLPTPAHVYFVHSYFVESTDNSCVVATSEYGSNIVAAVKKGNIWATQFHPEKSGDVGLSILKFILAETL